MPANNPYAFPMPIAGVGKRDDAEWTRLDEITPIGESQWLGMTLRDYFAAHALSGFIASHSNSGCPASEEAAQAAFKYADAMLEARGVSPSTKPSISGSRPSSPAGVSAA